MSWAGLRAARDSSDLWMSLISDGGRIPAVGVFVNQKSPQVDNRIMSAVTGLPLRMQSHLGEGLKWAGGEASLVAGPPSYEVCILSFGIEYLTEIWNKLGRSVSIMPQNLFTLLVLQRSEEIH